jgi:hypothetical protein
VIGSMIQASPHSNWPGCACKATPQSSRSASDAGALANVRSHLEVVHDSLCSREPKTQALSCRKSIQESPLQIRDTRPLIGGDYPDPCTATVVFNSDFNLTPVRVVDDVAGQLRDSGGNESLIATRKAQLDRERSPPLPSRNNIDLGNDGDK